MTFGFVTNAKAQICCDEACFYTTAGSSYCSFIAKFDCSNKIVWFEHTSLESLKQNLANSKDYYENKTMIQDFGRNSIAEMSSIYQIGVNKYFYDYKKSTETKEVYKTRGYIDGKLIGYDQYYGSPRYEVLKGWWYLAFSKDKSSIICWFEEDDNYDGQIKERTDFIRVPKEDLLPKAVNYDFLNE